MHHEELFIFFLFLHRLGIEEIKTCSFFVKKRTDLWVRFHSFPRGKVYSIRVNIQLEWSIHFDQSETLLFKGILCRLDFLSLKYLLFQRKWKKLIFCFLCYWIIIIENKERKFSYFQYEGEYKGLEDTLLESVTELNIRLKDYGQDLVRCGK